MLRKKKLCKCGCGVTDFLWSKGYIKSCYFKLNKPKSIKKISTKGVELKKIKTENTRLQFLLFDEIWKEHKTKTCFECGKWVDGKSSSHFHHLLFKSQYPEYKFEKWNIVLICENCHSQVHVNIDKTPRVKEETLRIKIINNLHF